MLRQGNPLIAVVPTSIRTGIVALCLLAGTSVSGQAGTLTTLYRFTGGADGALTYRGLTLDKAGNLYGEAFYGANACPDSYQYASIGCGTLYQLSRTDTLTPLITFLGASNGASPESNVTLSGTTLLGTTFTGGTDNQGTLFQVKTDGTAYRLLHSFIGTDGEHPSSFPRLDASHNIFSVTNYGGPGYNGTDDSGLGVLFEVTAANQFIPLHYFSGGADGSIPGRIFLDGTGTIYGTTDNGGSCSLTGGCGVIYSYVPATGAFTTLYTFTGGTDGNYPTLAGIDSRGNLLGSTLQGGAHGYGTLFELKKGVGGTYTYVNLWAFTGGSDGDEPISPALAANDEMVGTTFLGPITSTSSGAGTLFVFKSGHLTTLYTFTGGADGGYPEGTPVIAPDGSAAYGTTAYGGITPCNTSAGLLISSFGCGTIYKYTR